MTLDEHIADLQSQFNSKLWTSFNNRFLGRTYRIAEKREQKTQPHQYLGANEYKCVFYDDNYDSTIIFDVEPTSETITETVLNSDVNIIVALDLGKIYGINTIADEEAHKAVLNTLSRSEFKVNNIIRGIDAYNDFDLTDTQKIRYNRSPLYVFKLECSLQHSYNC